MFNPRFSTALEGNRNDIETERSIGRRGMRQEMQRRLCDPTALFATHGELIALGFVGLASLHFYENDRRVL